MTSPAVPLSSGARKALLLLVFVPALPGLTFLLAAFATDPHWHPRDPSPAGQAQYAQAWERTRGLYLAGALTLMVGTLGMGAVVYKIARPGSYEEDDKAAAAAQSDEPHTGA